jgi:hypothetical protein
MFIMPLPVEKKLPHQIEILKNLQAKGQEGSPKDVENRRVEIERTSRAATRTLRAIAENLRWRQVMMEIDEKDNGKMML